VYFPAFFGRPNSPSNFTAKILQSCDRSNFIVLLPKFFSSLSFFIFNQQILYSFIFSLKIFLFLIPASVFLLQDSSSGIFILLLFSLRYRILFFTTKSSSAEAAFALPPDFLNR
jgi:hypothetical protein